MNMNQPSDPPLLGILSLLLNSPKRHELCKESCMHEIGGVKICIFFPAHYNYT